MTRQEIEAVFERVRTWPEQRREDAARTLLILEEQGTESYELTDEDRAALEEAEAEIERGEFATEEEVQAVFAQFRGR